ncbi:hypothetical protein [Mycobacterium avium]|uniref:hypothetical protein n=2 Tax=Mycobacterium avium TaxID=1764 RepID=UPI001CD9BA87|nr:hypothetical protein [Mycobacterium avium]MCA2240564.1 hypothetical protein [Mycobacterium avium]MCA2261678.1 hypothetical protein [Mycobacterium avium]MCA2291628.1 hypothetical protein [Mycobacterium avium]MCA4711533.1 hypothetical protein [Mycobacterium avium subsp. hominissuis]
MIDQAEVWIQRARQLLGTSVPPEVPLPRYEPAPQHPDEWTGEASDRARDLDEKLAQRRLSLRSAHSSVADTVRQANLLTQKAQGELAAVERAWQRDKAAFAHISGTAEGRAALLRAAQSRINEASQVVRDAAAQFQFAAAQVHTATSNVTLLDTYASTDASHIQNVSAEALGVQSIPPKTGDDWDHIEEILEHWNRTSNAGLPAMPDPWPPEF